MPNCISPERLRIAGFTLFVGSCLAVTGYLSTTTNTVNCSNPSEPVTSSLCSVQNGVSIVFYLAAACCLGLNCIPQNTENPAQNNTEMDSSSMAYNKV